MQELTGGVESIEEEAEKILSSAKSKAREILQKAKESSHQLISSDLPLDNVKADCKKIIALAEEEAKKQTEDMKRKAQLIKKTAEKRKDKFYQQMIDIITGAESK